MQWSQIYRSLILFFKVRNHFRVRFHKTIFSKRTKFNPLTWSHRFVLVHVFKLDLYSVFVDVKTLWTDADLVHTAPALTDQELRHTGSARHLPLGVQRELLPGGEGPHPPTSPHLVLVSLVQRHLARVPPHQTAHVESN